MIKKIVLWFLTWRISLLVVAFLGLKLVPLKTDFLGTSEDIFLKKPLLWCWANFDGFHYLTIAQRGYFQFQQAFFPFYPLFIRFLARFLKDYLFSGLLISHLAFLAALFLFYQLIKLDFEKKIAQKSLLYLLLFPTAFFFGSVYSESIFLLIILASFYAARKKHWLLAGVLGGIASATRFVGLFLFPALIAEWWQEKKEDQNGKLVNLLPLFLIFFGFLAYMGYLRKTVGDPLYFIHVQPLFGAERTGGKLILLYQVFWRYFKMIMTTKPDPLYLAVWLEFLTASGFLGLLISAYFQKMRLSYLIFAFSAYLIPTLTGTFSSMPRYVLVLFPSFIMLALWAEKYRWLKILYPVFAIILTAVAVMFFTRGWWVA